MSLIEELPAPLLDTGACTVIRPADAGYDTARRAWNLVIEQRPAAIVQPESAEEVRRDRLRARARTAGRAQGTGHGAWTMGSLADTVLVRTDRMAAVEIDPVARVARVGAGARWRDVVGAAAVHGLAAAPARPTWASLGTRSAAGWASSRASTDCPATAWWRSSWSPETASSGARIDAHHEPELFWAVRGGGGNFGVVCCARAGALAPHRGRMRGSCGTRSPAPARCWTAGASWSTRACPTS